jgi:hypothetical protein
MNAIENVSAVAQRALCLALAALIVSAGLLLGSIGVDAQFNSAQRAQVTVEFVSADANVMTKGRNRNQNALVRASGNAA